MDQLKKLQVTVRKLNWYCVVWLYNMLIFECCTNNSLSLNDNRVKNNMTVSYGICPFF